MAYSAGVAGLCSKDPAAILDFTVDWEGWLGAGDTIQTSTWAVPSPIIAVMSNHQPFQTRVQVSGGVVGRMYQMVNHIVTVGGIQDERTFHLVVEQR